MCGSPAGGSEQWDRDAPPLPQAGNSQVPVPQAPGKPVTPADYSNISNPLSASLISLPSQLPICKTMIATAPASHSARAWILLKTPRIPIQLKHSHVKLHMDLCLSFWGFYTFYPNKSGHNKCSEPPQGTCYILECPQMSWCLLWTFPEGLVTPQTLGSCWRSRVVSRMSSLSSQNLELPSHRSSSVHSKPFLSTQKPWVRVSTCQQVTNLQDLRVVMSFNYII